MSTWKFLPYTPPSPENAPRDRVTPLLPPAPPEDEAPPTRLRVDAVPDAWERQSGEGEEAWAKFMSYRDSPRPRRMARPGVGAHNELFRLANEWRWYQRVEAYDNHLDRIRRKEMEAWLKQDAKEVAAEHMAILRDAREFCAIEVQRILERARASSIDGTLKAGETLKLLEMVVKYDRLLRNQTTENAQVRVDETSLEHMTVEELREAQTLAAKMFAQQPK